MKFLWFNIETKKELREHVSTLEAANDMLSTELNAVNEKLKEYETTFPLKLGQTVYDVALRSAEGKYTKKNPSLEHSCVTPVVVEKKNYFTLADRVARKDVFYSEESANEYLKSICK